SSGDFFINCNTAINTTGTPAWQNLCPGLSAPAYSVIQVGGRDTVLLHCDTLAIDAGVTFRALGTKPLIIAVRGNATVLGNIDVGSPAGGNIGAGANVACTTGT